MGTGALEHGVGGYKKKKKKRNIGTLVRKSNQ